MSTSAHTLYRSPLASRVHARAAFAIATCLLMCGGTYAQTSPSANPVSPAATSATIADSASTYGDRESASSADSLHVSFTPYAWLTSFNGTVGARGIEVDVNQSFSDIFDASESIFGLMGALDFTYERFIFQINGAYTSAEFDEDRGRTRTGPLGTQVDLDGTLDLELETTWFEAMAGYRFYESTFGQDYRNGISIDAFGGARVSSVGIDQTLTTLTSIALPNGTVLESGQTRSLDDSQVWVEPFVGLRTNLRLGENWELLLRGDVGGFGVSDSDFSWQVVAGVGYRWYYDAWSLGLFGGYRALGQDYSDGEFVWDVVTHGPILGFSINFSF